VTGPDPSPLVIAARYEIVRTLAGGMGVVHLCVDRADEDHPVALKTFKPEFLPNVKIRERFIREASIWIELGFHPNIVQAFRVEHLAEHFPWIVLELVPCQPGRANPSLRCRLTPGRGTSLEEALRCALGVAQAMRHACTQVKGLVHRDLKPENILFGIDDTAKVTDFGIAAIAPFRGEASPEAPLLPSAALTMGAIGTPIYMSPEQWSGRPVSASSDIYSLGCIVLEMLVGRPPVRGRTAAEIGEGHLAGSALTMAKALALPRSVRNLLEECLMPEPERRLTSWETLTARLRAVCEAELSLQLTDQEAPIDASRSTQLQRGASYVGIGIALTEIGRYASAEASFHKALRVAESQESPLLAANAWADLGVVAAEQGSLVTAIDKYRKAVDLWGRLGNQRMVAVNLMNMGNAQFSLGDMETAQSSLTSALADAEASGDVESVASCKANLANVLFARGRPDEGVRLFSESREMFVLAGNLSGQLQCLAGEAMVYEAQGQTRRATSIYHQVIETARSVGDMKHEALAHLGLGNARLREGQPGEAAHHFKVALEQSRSVGDRHSEAKALGNLGAALASQMRLPEAISFLEEAIRIGASLQIPDVLARAHWALGLVQEVLGHSNEALKHQTAGIALFKEFAMPDLAEASRHYGDFVGSLRRG
jgi:serine/threonine protein kinase